MNIEDRLAGMGIILPEVNPPLASYVPWAESGEYVFVSGQLPMKAGDLLYKGKIGQDLTLQEGQAAAECAAINCLAVLKACLGEWERLLQIVRLSGYVQCAPDFYQQPLVINGASVFLEKVLGAKGQHSRVVVGVQSLPLNAACEIDMIARIIP